MVILAPDYKAHIIIFIYSLDQYRFLHKGHCGGSGYIPPNANPATIDDIDDCLKECKCRKDVKFFAYAPSGKCACYKTECLDDGNYLDHKAYEIVEDGDSGTDLLINEVN